MNRGTAAIEHSNEPVKYPGLRAIDLTAEATAVFQGKYRWHVHPTSDEPFVVPEGAIVIELKDGASLHAGPLQAATVPAGAAHRTIGVGRTVNLCFEKTRAETVFVDE